MLAALSWAQCEKKNTEDQARQTEFSSILLLGTFQLECPFDHSQLIPKAKPAPNELIAQNVKWHSP